MTIPVVSDPTKLSERLYGVKAPRHVVKALRRAFPQVRLYWHPHFKCWSMVQRLWNGAWQRYSGGPFKGQLEPFRTLGPTEVPTLQNTVYHCQRWSLAVSRQEKLRLLEEMDSNNPVLATQRRAQEAMSYHARELAGHVVWPKLSLRVAGVRDLIQATGPARQGVRRRPRR